MKYPEFLSDQAVRWLLSTLTLEQVARLLCRGSDVLYEVTDDMDQAHLLLNAVGAQLAQHLTEEQTAYLRGWLREHGQCNDVDDA